MGSRRARSERRAATRAARARLAHAPVRTKRRDPAALRRVLGLAALALFMRGTSSHPYPAGAQDRVAEAAEGSTPGLDADDVDDVPIRAPDPASAMPPDAGAVDLDGGVDPDAITETTPDAATAPSEPPPPDPLEGITLARAPDARADLFVVVSVDGLRPDAIRPAHAAFQRLIRGGSVALDAQTIARSSTLPSHASMVSGVDVDLHGLAFNAWIPERGAIRFPTIFRIARGAGLPTAMFVAKRKLEHLVDAGGAETFEVPGGHCADVAAAAATWIDAHDRGVVLVHFLEPDSAGHRRGWMTALYHGAVRESDRCLGVVAAAVRRRGPRALLLVTADHGGHGRNHGQGLPIDRHIPWILAGPAARRARVERPISTMDTAATVLFALGLPHAPSMVGVPVVEALR